MSPLRVLHSATAPADPSPPRIMEGSGSRLVDSNGRELIDGSNTSALLGHGHPDLVQALRRAADEPIVADMWSSQLLEDATAELAETAFAGEDWIGGVRFLLSGSEANDQALTLSQVITDREPIAVRERAYHGGVGLARDATVQSHWHGGFSSRHGGARPPRRRSDVEVFPAGPCADDGDRGHCLTCRCADAAAEALRGSAAAILDCTQGGSYLTPVFTDRVADACRTAGALLIADEVVTGLGRTGHWFAFQRGKSRPDIITLGKGLTGGAAPGGALVISKELFDQLREERWQSYGTLRGHPLSLAALRATVGVIHRDGLVERAAALGRVLARGLADLANRHPAVVRVVGVGLHWTVFLTGPGDRRGTVYLGDGVTPTLASRIAAECLTRGALIGTSGEPDSLFIAPPLVITESELSALLEALDAALEVADRLLLEAPTSHHDPLSSR